MASKTWKMSVTTLGASQAEPLHEVTVEAENWMAALRLARSSIGEIGAVPPGASCSVSPDGNVTILDGAAQRRYALRAAQPSVPPAAAQAAAAPIPKTAAVPVEAKVIVDASLLTEPASAATEPKSATPQTGEVRMLQSRPAEIIELQTLRPKQPSDNPVLYVERWLGATRALDQTRVDAALRIELERLEVELSLAPTLVRIAFFEGVDNKENAKVPKAVLSWTTWKREIDIAYHATGHTIVPPAHTDASSEPRMSLTPQQDDRLADAFEVCQDLQLSETPADALKMVLDLLRRTVPCEAITTALYDINTDEFRFVALDGPGAEQLRGKAISPSEGLIAAAAGAIGTAMLIEDVSVDDRYRAALDGRPGLEPRTMMLLGVGHERRLLGMIQLINRVEQAQFSRADAHVVTYIGKQLGEYLHTMRSNFTRPNTSIRPGR